MTKKERAIEWEKSQRAKEKYEEPDTTPSLQEKRSTFFEEMVKNLKRYPQV